MEYACKVCGAAVHVFGGAGETRCAGCEAPPDAGEGETDMPNAPRVVAGTERRFAALAKVGRRPRGQGRCATR